MEMELMGLARSIWKKRHMQTDLKGQRGKKLEGKWDKGKMDGEER